VILNEVFEVSFFGPFGYYNKLVVVGETIDIFDYVRMAQRLHQLNFFLTLLALLGIHHIKDLFGKIIYLNFLTAMG
jgi:hypothetical protein